MIGNSKKAQKVIQVYCGEACLSNDNSSEQINLSNHDYNQVLANITTRFDRFIETPQELPDRVIDLLHIASYVFCADRSAYRGRRDSLSNSGWSRNWNFEIPILDYDFWSKPEVSIALSNALVFMTGDKSYNFRFRKATLEPLKTEEYQMNLFSSNGFNLQCGSKIDVMLFSGGLDSLAGAIERLNTFPDRQLCLINHMSNNRTIRTQRILTKELQMKYPDRVFPYTFECRFNKLKSRDETQRTRMFLFSAIAFAICTYYSKDEFFVYENGITSLNLSKQADVINARSSRTTHPKVIGLLQNFYKLFSDKFRIQTPYYYKTKEDIVKIFANYNELNLIQNSVSCSSTRNTHESLPHCGCCSQCIDRRFATYAAGLQDKDFTYMLDIAKDPLDDETKQRVSALLYFTENEIGNSKYEFLKKHPKELLDIIDFWPGSAKNADNSLDEIFNLYCRYRDSIKRAIANMQSSLSNGVSTNKLSMYGRVIQRREYEEKKQVEFNEKIKHSVFILNSRSNDHPRQGSGFYLNAYGLLTCHHVVEDNEFYDVCTYVNFPKSFKVVGTGLSPIIDSKENDFTLFSMEKVPQFFEVGDSSTLQLGNSVKLIGYSSYNEGDSYDLMNTDIRKISNYFHHPLYEVSTTVFHGASGGIVLDERDRVVGLICAGVESMDEADINSKQGFIPINTILQEISYQKSFKNNLGGKSCVELTK